MKKIIYFIIFIVFSIFILSGWERYTSFFEEGTRGVAVINNSSINIKSISINKYHSTETGLNADGSPIKKGDYMFFQIDQSKNRGFSITITDNNDKQYNSQLFYRDFSYDSVYYIYIVDSENGKNISFEVTKKN